MKNFNDPKAILNSTALVETFTEIVRIDTQANSKSDTTPSTSKQLDLQQVLEKKLKALGCTDVELDDKGYLYATFPGNVDNTPVIGLIAHVDTAMDYSGTGVEPIVHTDYDGSDIVLPGGVTIDKNDSPQLAQCVGDTIITASGDTLLGADDKAGVAAILAAIEALGKNPDISRPTLRIAFTPDEEIGRGATWFDTGKFNAFCAYTLDGSWEGEVNFETFSADKADVTFTGVAVHPGYATGKMVNALRYLGMFLDRLPRDEAPETTEGRTGFTHPITIEGNASQAMVTLILREFDNDKLVERGNRLRALVESIAKEEPKLKATVEITEQYRNMADTLTDHPKVREYLVQAVTDAGVTPDEVPVRGGTDGSGLTAKGLPTPNLFAGGMNFHGPREWVSTRVMALSVCTVLNLVQHWAEEK